MVIQILNKKDTFEWRSGMRFWYVENAQWVPFNKIAKEKFQNFLRISRLRVNNSKVLGEGHVEILKKLSCENSCCNFYYVFWESFSTARIVLLANLNRCSDKMFATFLMPKAEVIGEKGGTLCWWRMIKPPFIWVNLEKDSLRNVVQYSVGTYALWILFIFESSSLSLSNLLSLTSLKCRRRPWKKATD